MSDNNHTPMSALTDDEKAATLAVTNQTPVKLLATITTDLLDDRDRALAEQNTAEAKVKAINRKLADILTLTATSRHEMTDGSVVSWVQPGNRSAVMPEKLLAAGVDAKIITGATVETPVAGFVRIDRPKTAREAARAKPDDFVPAFGAEPTTTPQ